MPGRRILGGVRIGGGMSFFFFPWGFGGLCFIIYLASSGEVGGVSFSIYLSKISVDYQILPTKALRKPANTFNRVKALKEEPWTQKESEAAVGLRTDNGPTQRAGKQKRGDVEMEDSLLDVGEGEGEGLAT